MIPTPRRLLTLAAPVRLPVRRRAPGRGAARVNAPVSAEPCVAVMASFPEELAAIEKMMVAR